MPIDTLFPESEKISLGKSIDLYCLNTDEYKRSRLDIFFTFPADRHLSPLIRLLLSVLFRGSKNFPTLAHMNKHLDYMYDSTIYWKDYHLGANHTYRISCTTLDNKFLPSHDKKLDLMGNTLKVVEDVLLNPIMDRDGYISKKHFNSEVAFAIDNLNSKLNTPKTYASIKCNEMLFGDDPAGISLDGTEEILSSYTRKELTEIREYFLRCANISVFYVGTDSSKNISSKLEDMFSKIQNRTPIDLVGKYALSPSEYKEKTETFNLTQGRLNLGLTCDTLVGDDDSAVMSLYNEILGGSSTSKLFLNVREKMSLCYSCFSGIDTCCGIMAISCGVKCENKDVALVEIKNQIEEMRIGNITDDEIATAKRGLVNSLNQMPDSAASLVVASFKYKVLTHTDVTISRRIQEINDITKEDIVKFAQKVTLCSVFFLDSNGQNNDGEDCEND